MNFKDELKRRTLEAEAVVRNYLPKEEGFQKYLIEASNYSVTAGGKRLRPVIMKASFDAFGGKGRAVEPFMAALEMIHSSSLVHDDLPCMDNDEYRRGNLTTWKKYGYDMAVLAGDDLLMYAIETASKAFEFDDVNVQSAARAISILASKAGKYGMIGGQSVDVEYTDKSITKEQLDFIYRLKTGALLESAMMIGAVLAGADEESTALAGEAALNVGMAFQIRDDILDVISTTQELGKPVNSDEKNNKTTYVTLYGIEGASGMVEEYSEKAVSILEKLDIKQDFLKELFVYLIDRKK